MPGYLLCGYWTLKSGTHASLPSELYTNATPLLCDFGQVPLALWVLIYLHTKQGGAELIAQWWVSCLASSTKNIYIYILNEGQKEGKEGMKEARTEGKG